MSAKLLLHPLDRAPVARISGDPKSPKIEMLDTSQFSLFNLDEKGFFVSDYSAPQSSIKDKIYQKDTPGQFEKVFMDSFLPDVAGRGSFYLVSEDDYIGPEGEIQKAVEYVLGIRPEYREREYLG